MTATRPCLLGLLAKSLKFLGGSRPKTSALRAISLASASLVSRLSFSRLFRTVALSAALAGPWILSLVSRQVYRKAHLDTVALDKCISWYLAAMALGVSP